MGGRWGGVAALRERLTQLYEEQRVRRRGMATTQDLEEEINRAAEYAGFPSRWVARVVERDGDVWVEVDGRVYQVDLAWALGNVRRLADRCSVAQMVHALEVSHPGVMGVSSKQRARG